MLRSWTFNDFTILTVCGNVGSVSATTKKPLTAGPMLRVYEHLVLPAMLPGASTLTMKIEKKGRGER